MTNKIVPYIFPTNGRELRVVMVGNEPWWVARDVAALLGYRDAANALRIVDSEDRGTHRVSTPGGDQHLSTVNEAGLYRLIMRSDKPIAQPFQRWVTREVLPEIRKTGTFTAPAAPAAQAAPFEIPTTFSEALLLAAQQAEALEVTKASLVVAEQTVQEERAKVAELEPKAQAVDTYMEKGANLLVREVAKLFGLRQKDLFFLLVEKGYLFRRRNSFNEYYYDTMAKYREAGYFAPKMYRWRDADGAEHITYTPYVTPKGVEQIRKMLRQLADKGNRPAIRHGQATRPTPLTALRSAS